MSALLRTHHIVLVGLGCAVAAITACSAPEPTANEGDEGPAPKMTQASSVNVEIIDVKGTSLGTCSGTLLSPKLVLTAGHCIAGAAKWKITSQAGSSDASVGSTSWKNFGSDKTHPEHSDVGLILLDNSIKLDTYPTLASSKADDGEKVTRFHRASAAAKEAKSTLSEISYGDDKGFKVNYLMEAAKGEFLDVGGAVIDSNGKIIGVVSGRGKQSDLLHIARVDGFATWTKAAASCSTGLDNRSWGGGNGSTPNKPGGGGWNTGPGGSTWGSSSGGYGGGGGKGGGGMMDGGAGVPGADGGNGGGGNGGGTTSGGPGGSSGGPNDGPTTGGGSGPGGGSCPGTPSCTGDGCGAGSNGGGGGSGGDTEKCTGTNDNPADCPPGPDSANCSGPNCGGTSAAGGDSTMEYGACSACGGAGPIVR